MLLWMLTLPQETIIRAYKTITLPVLLILPLGTLCFGKLLSNQEEQIKIANELAEKEKLLRETGEIAKIGAWEFDINTGQNKWTDEVLRIHDLNPDHENNIEIGHSLYSAESLKKIETAIKEAIEFNKAYELELEMTTAKGINKWVRILGTPIFENNKVIKVRGSFQDITERKRAEESLRESEQKYRELVMLANSIILRWTRDGRITFLNEFGQRFFGYTEAEICGRHVVGTIVPASESSGRDLPLLMDEICANPAAFEQNINENMRRNGEHVWIAWTNKVVLDPQGQAAEILSIGVDITERRKMQEELRKWSEELEKKVEQRTKALIAARESALNIFNSSMDAVMLLTPEKGFFKGNPATIEIFGCRDDSEFTRMSPADLSPKYQPDGKLSTVKAQEMMAIAMEKGSHCFEWTHKRVNGQEFFADVLLTRMKWEDRMILQATVRDITERIKSEKAVGNLLADLQEAKVFLEASITGFHNIVAKSIDGIVIVAKTGIVQFANPAAETFLGDREKKFIGQLFRFPIETDQITEIDIIRDNKEPGFAEMRVVETKWNNNPAWLALLRDITDRKQAEEELKKSKNMFKSVVTTVPVGIGVVVDRKITWANDNFLRLVGRSQEEIINQSTRILYASDEGYDFVGNQYYKELREKGKAEVETKWKHKDGRIIDIFLTGAALDAQNLSRGVIFGALDTTDRKRAEDLLRESEEKFRTIFESSNDGILIADAKNKKFFTGNKAICDMLGYSIEEIRKIDISDIHPKEDLPFIEEQFDKLARKEIASAGNIPMKRKDGSIFFADINANPTIISGKTYLIGSFRDITERKLTEEKLKEAMKAKTEFTSVVSHELRTPLTAIKEGIALVTDGIVGEINDEQRELLGISKKNVDRLARLINDILDFQKLDSGVMKFNFGANNINEITKDVYATMTSSAKKAGGGYYAPAR
jgi:PAS domain S-box-containing protein